MKDLFGQAMFDHYRANTPHKLWINNRYGPKEEMPLDIYFRTQSEMPHIELLALNKCYGKLLDIGAGAGSHALVLQQRGYDITALEISELAAGIMKDRGVEQIIRADIFEYITCRYDTLLLLMNGIGLTGSIARLRLFLQQAKQLINRDGQLLFDSSDIAYLYKDKLPPGEKYYGELEYQYQYNGKKTEWFQWLYIDRGMLAKVAANEGWAVQILAEDDMDQYLARLTTA